MIRINFGNAQVFDSHRISVCTCVYIRMHTQVCEHAHACGMRVTREWTHVDRQVARERYCTCSLVGTVLPGQHLQTPKDVPGSPCASLTIVFKWEEPGNEANCPPAQDVNRVGYCPYIALYVP